MDNRACSIQQKSGGEQKAEKPEAVNLLSLAGKVGLEKGRWKWMEQPVAGAWEESPGESSTAKRAAVPDALWELLLEITGFRALAEPGIQPEPSSWRAEQAQDREENLGGGASKSWHLSIHALRFLCQSPQPSKAYLRLSCQQPQTAIPWCQRYHNAMVSSHNVFPWRLCARRRKLNTWHMGNIRASDPKNLWSGSPSQICFGKGSQSIWVEWTQSVYLVSVTLRYVSEWGRRSFCLMMGMAWHGSGSGEGGEGTDNNWFSTLHDTSAIAVFFVCFFKLGQQRQQLRKECKTKKRYAGRGSKACYTYIRTPLHKLCGTTSTLIAESKGRSTMVSAQGSQGRTCIN